jgi:hypothetical protein
MFTPLLDDVLRPRAVTSAAALAVTQAVATLIATIIVGLAFVQGGLWHPASLVVLVQLAGCGLLTVGAVRILLGVERGTLLAGAVLEVLICAAYAVYAVTVVPHGPTENANTVVALISVAVVLAAAPLVIIGLARCQSAVEYVGLIGPGVRARQ